MKLSELVKPITHLLEFDLTSDAEIELLTESSNEACENALFACLRGAHADGHTYAAQALQKGCRVFLTDQRLPLPDGCIQLKVSDTRHAYALLCAAFYKHPTEQMQVIGITGTKGKTTTACLLTQILNQAGIKTGYIGTNGIEFGDVKKPSVNTTPDAKTLQSTFLEMLRHGCRTAVVEVSSQAILQHRIDGTNLDSVAFTNLFPDHLGPGEHPDFSDYLNCKKKLFSSFDAKKAYFCKDNPYFEEFFQASTAAQKFVCSMEDRTADFVAASVVSKLPPEEIGVSFSISSHEDAFRCFLPMIGRFNVQNALMALAIANGSFGIPFSFSGRCLAKAAVAGRGEIIRLSNGAFAVIDYAHNGPSMRQMLKALSDFSPKKLIVLFGSVGERTKLRRAELARAASEYADVAFLTSDNPGNEDPSAVIEEIASAMDSEKVQIYQIADRKEAIEKAVTLSEKGDILLLAGKGHEEFQLIGNEKKSFSEKEILSSLFAMK